MVAAAIRTLFAQPDADHVRSQLDVIAACSPYLFPQLEAMLRDPAEDHLLAFTALPISHWKKTWSTNPLERLNKEIKRRTDVIGVFPTPQPCSGWPTPCWSRRTTNGRSATAATSPKAPWPSSTDHPRRGGDAAGPDRVMVTLLTNTVRTTSTTQRDVTAAPTRARVRVPGQGLCSSCTTCAAAPQDTSSTRQRGRAPFPGRPGAASRDVPPASAASLENSRSATNAPEAGRNAAQRPRAPPAACGRGPSVEPARISSAGRSVPRRTRTAGHRW
jgi:Transposase, Mutator family